MRDKKYYYLPLCKIIGVSSEQLLAGTVGLKLMLDEDLTDAPEDFSEFKRKYKDKLEAAIEQCPESKESYDLIKDDCDLSWYLFGRDWIELYNFSKGIKSRDIVLCKEGLGKYRIGEINGNYKFCKGDEFPHQRPILWLPGHNNISYKEMSPNLRGIIPFFHNSVVNISGFAKEISDLISVSGVCVFFSEEFQQNLQNSITDADETEKS